MSEVIETTSQELNPGTDMNFFGEFIMNSLIAYCNDTKTSWPFGQRLEIVLTVNGQEIPLRPAIDAIEKNLNRLVLTKAEELIRSKLQNVHQMIDGIESYLRITCYQLKNQTIKDKNKE